MNDVKKIDDLLISLELAIKEFRKNIHNNHQPLSNHLNNIKVSLEKVLLFLSVVEDSELDQQRQIYTHIARFIQAKLDKSIKNWNHYLSAVYFMCEESDPRLLIENTPSISTQQLITAAQKNIIAIKVHYEKIKEREICNRKLEIFSILNNKDKPTITRIEEEISWDSLPSEIRHTFLNENNKKVSFRIYQPGV